MAENKMEEANNKSTLHPQIKILMKNQGGYESPYVAVKFSDSEDYKELKSQLFNKGDRLIVKPSEQKIIDGKLVSKFSAFINGKDYNYDLGEFDSFDKLFCTLNMAQCRTSRFVNIHPELLKVHENRFALAAYLMQGSDLGFVIEYDSSKLGVPAPCYSAYYCGLKSPYKGNDTVKYADPEIMDYVTTISLQSADDVCTLLQSAFANALRVNGRIYNGGELVNINRHQIESRVLRYAPNTGLISVIPSTHWGKIFSFYNSDIIAEPYSYNKELKYGESVGVGSPLFQIDTSIYDPNEEKQFAALQKLIAMQNANSSGRQPE